MGGSFDYRNYDHDDRKKIRRLFEDACEQAKIEDGISYPGTIAAMRTVGEWRDKRFTTYREAESYLCDEHNKWDEAMAVSYLLPKPETKRDLVRAEKAQAKLNAAQTKLNEAENKVRKEFTEAKSKTVGCKGCGSKMSREHLAKFLRHKAIRCPLCNGDLLSATWRKRQAKLTEAVDKARTERDAAQSPSASTKVGWIVGGWCSS